MSIMGSTIQRGQFLVEVLADSVVVVDKSLFPGGYHRITTFRLIFPRIILAEFNTHRLLSKNSASSRARPIETVIGFLLNNPFIPTMFPKAHKKMVASDWITSDQPEFENIKNIWLMARDMLVAIARLLLIMGISKQLVNRFLEPLMMHEVIVTATEWENFTALRAHGEAQLEIQIIAEMILEALNTSKPNVLKPGEWHLPYGDQIDSVVLHSALWNLEDKPNSPKNPSELERIIATARCARVSYKSFDGGKSDYIKDFDMVQGLIKNGHWSPFEHAAQAMNEMEYETYTHTYPNSRISDENSKLIITEYGWCGNFRGFVQYRKGFERNIEERSDPRIFKLEI